MNIFDTLKTKAFDTVTYVMGYDAVWVSSVSGMAFTSRVGYKDPSEKEKLSGIAEWNPDIPYMEYRIGFFPELKENVDAGYLEYVTIYDTNPSTGVQFIKAYAAVREVKTAVDGDVFKCKLELIQA